MFGADKAADGSNVVWEQKKSEFLPKLLASARRVAFLSAEIRKLWHGSAWGEKVREVSLGQVRFQVLIPHLSRLVR